MDTELFHSWLENGVNESIVEQRVKKPMLLLIDRAKCHISIQAGEFCKENNIILYTLYLNATHIIQPLDLVLMNTVKTNYWSEVRHLLKENPGALYDKYVFIQVFKEVWQKSAKVEYAIKGFKESGIYPINPDAIKKGKQSCTNEMSLYRPGSRAHLGPGNFLVLHCQICILLLLGTLLINFWSV